MQSNIEADSSSETETLSSRHAAQQPGHETGWSLHLGRDAGTSLYHAPILDLADLWPVMSTSVVSAGFFCSFVSVGYLFFSMCVFCGQRDGHLSFLATCVCVD